MCTSRSLGTFLLQDRTLRPQGTFHLTFNLSTSCRSRHQAQTPDKSHPLPLSNVTTVLPFHEQHTRPRNRNRYCQRELGLWRWTDLGATERRGLITIFCHCVVSSWPFRNTQSGTMFRSRLSKCECDVRSRLRAIRLPLPNPLCRGHRPPCFMALAHFTPPSIDSTEGHTCPPSDTTMERNCTQGLYVTGRNIPSSSCPHPDVLVKRRSRPPNRPLTSSGVVSLTDAASHAYHDLPSAEAYFLRTP
ncbi:hypothetical protein LX36DRAFT_161430 [Colletotrichum falcatum]|nr:hypothetical protein LX36DRAFT_161430 [Colletotrichum falcatum]